MKKSLSMNIAVRIGLVVLVATLALGIFSTIYTANTMIDTQENYLEILSNESAQRISDTLDRRLAVLNEIAEQADITSMTWVTQRRALTSKVESLGYVEMFVFDTSGEAHYVINGKTADLSDREYFKQALAGNRYVSNILISKSTQTAAIYYSVPIKDRSGTVIGVLAGKKDGTALNKITDELGVGANGYAYVLGADGTLYAHPNAENVMNQVNITDPNAYDGKYADFGKKYTALGDNKEGILHYDVDGKTILSALANIPGTDWTLGIASYESDILKDIRTLQFVLIIFSIIVLIIGLVLGFFIGKRIAKPITILDKMFSEMAQYDFSHQLDSKDLKHLDRKDEIGRIAEAAFSMKENLVSLLKSVASSSEHLASSSEELTATTEQSAQASQDIAESIVTISAGAQEQNQSTRQSLNDTNQLADFLATSDQYYKVLHESLNQVEASKNDGIITVNDLKEKNKETMDYGVSINRIVNETADSVQKIETASNMIKSISEQTNLLALNAAIEAARAGEAGRGFAVVAEEIKNLADDSARFTDEIANIIKELLLKTEKAVESTDLIGNIMAKQSDSVQSTADRFNEIETAIERMNSDIQNIADLNPQTLSVMQQLVESIKHLQALSNDYAEKAENGSAAVEEQTASMDEIANASESLANLAEELQNNVSQFKF